MKNNKAKIETVVNELGLIIGCYHEEIDLLSEKELDKVISNVEYQEDTDVKIKRKNYVVEIDIVDNEVDLKVLTKAEYIDRYGDSRYTD